MKKLFMYIVTFLLVAVMVQSWGATRVIQGQQVSITIDTTRGVGVYTIQERVQGVTISSFPQEECGLTNNVLTCDFMNGDAAIVYLTIGSGTVTGEIIGGYPATSSAISGDAAIPRAATCGDGTQQTGEQCDDGNQDNTDACTNNCRTAVCGDGIVRTDLQQGEQGLEVCDDGNTDDGDGCSSTCQEENLYVCRSLQASGQPEVNQDISAGAMPSGALAYNIYVASDNTFVDGGSDDRREGNRESCRAENGDGIAETLTEFYCTAENGYFLNSQEAVNRLISSGEASCPTDYVCRNGACVQANSCIGTETDLDPADPRCDCDGNREIIGGKCTPLLTNTRYELNSNAAMLVKVTNIFRDLRCYLYNQNCRGAVAPNVAIRGGPGDSCDGSEEDLDPANPSCNCDNNREIIDGKCTSVISTMQDQLNSNADTSTKVQNIVETLQCFLLDECPPPPPN